MSEQIFGDMSEEFDFDEEGMDYLDGPLSGWLKRKKDGAWFAYDCQPIIVGKLWHWTLVSARRQGPDPANLLLEAAAANNGSWLSVVEDRRASATSSCRLVVIENKHAAPVLGAVVRRPGR